MVNCALLVSCAVSCTRVCVSMHMLCFTQSFSLFFYFLLPYMHVAVVSSLTFLLSLSRSRSRSIDRSVVCWVGLGARADSMHGGMV